MLSRKWIFLTIGALCLLALASLITTFSIWDGGYPPGVFRISVRDAKGVPVPNANLSIYKNGTMEDAFGYPFDNYDQNGSLVSDANGLITAIRREGGIQFGGTDWRLFWLISMGDLPGPRFDCKLEAVGFEVETFDFNRLLQSPHQFYEDFPKAVVTIDDQSQVELPIYQHEFVLQGPVRRKSKTAD